MARIYSADVNILYREMLKTKPGMILTYTRMSKMIDVTVNGSSNYILTVARNRAKQEKKILFRAVNGIGIQRLDDHNTVRASRAYIESANKAAKAAIYALGCVKKFEKLSKEDQDKFHTAATIAGIVSQFCNPKTLEAVEAGVAIKGRPLGVTEVLAS